MSGGVKVTLPCDFGDKIYSIIHEKQPLELIVDEFRITRDELYIISDGLPIPYSKFGTYYFFDKQLAEYEFNRKRERYENNKYVSVNRC